MSDELDRLRADLEVLERWQYKHDLMAGQAILNIQKDIARLEAKADPWREAKEYFDKHKNYKSLSSDARQALAYVDHLTAEVDRLAKENAALGKRLEDVNRELAKSEAGYRDMLEEIKDRAAERDEALKRVAELEKEPEHTPAVLKRADEIAVGDVILAGGWIRTVTDIDANHSSQRIIKCNDWMAWFRNSDLVAVLLRPLFEAKTVVDMQPPFEGPIVGIEPILDPARVLATAVQLGWGPTVYAEMTLLRDAKPYPLKGGDK